MNSIIDFNFGVKNQARAVMHMLDREPDFADYDDGFYRVRIETRPWYNGRECGFVVSMGQHGYSGPYINIAVFEHRNSDNICALRWETDSSYYNHPLEDKNIFDVAYGGENKTKYDTAFSVPYGECGKIADWVYNQLKNFYKTEKKG